LTAGHGKRESRRVVALKRRQRGTDYLPIDRAMPGYYTERLAAERPRASYDLSPPRTRAYLEAEIEFLLAKTTSSVLALELGCGYGRVLERLLPRVRVAFGIGTSLSSLRMAPEYLGRKP